MSNARYRRKQLARRDGTLVPLPTDAPAPALPDAERVPATQPALPPQRDPDRG